MDTMVGSAYSPNVTRLDLPAFGTAKKPDPYTGSVSPAIQAIARKGPIRTTSIVFQLVPSVPLNLLQANPHRKGIMITNKDAVASLFLSFATVADGSSFPMAPGAVILLDFICPTDSLWVFATAAVAGVCLEFAPVAG